MAAAVAAAAALGESEQAVAVVTAIVEVVVAGERQPQSAERGHLSGARLGSTEIGPDACVRFRAFLHCLSLR